MPARHDVAGSAESQLAQYRASGDRRLRNRVVEDHGWLATVIARSYWTGREPLDDLVQVAHVGLVKAAERFDPSFGVEYTTFAGVTVRGELRRHYRDATSAVRLPRKIQELRYEVRAATDVLRERLRRAPTTAELAAYLRVDADVIIECLCAEGNVRVRSIDHDAERTPSRSTYDVERGFDDVESSDAFQEMAALLPERLRRIVEMRFVEQMKQSEIAAVFGVSQVHVSRLLRHALTRLRPQLEHREERAVSPAAPSPSSAVAVG